MVNILLHKNVHSYFYRLTLAIFVPRQHSCDTFQCLMGSFTQEMRFIVKEPKSNKLSLAQVAACLPTQIKSNSLSSPIEILLNLLVI